jgi:hypothetical protein
MNWITASESSWFVRRYRALTQDSWLAGVHRRLEAAAPALFRDLQSTAPPSNDAQVIRTFRESLVVGAAACLLVLAESWARQSQVARVTETLRRDAARLPVAQRIRIVALMLFSAIVTHLFLTGFDAPEPTTAARVVWAALLALIAVVMAGSSFLAAAWSDWSTRPERNGSTRA